MRQLLLVTDFLQMFFRKWGLVLTLVALIPILIYWNQRIQVQSIAPTDFSQDYFAGLAFKQGLNIYGQDLQDLIQQSAVFADYKINSVENFHPPFLAIVFSSLAGLDYATAFYVFSLISFLAYLLIVSYSIRKLGLPFQVQLLLLVISSFWDPFVFSLNMGQISVILALLLICFYELERRSYSLVAGCVLGLAANIKLFPLYLLFYLFKLKNFRTLCAAVIAFVTIFTLSTALVGLEQQKTYLFSMVPRDVLEWGTYAINISIRSIIMPAFVDNTYIQNYFNSNLLSDVIIYGLSLLFLSFNLLSPSKHNKEFLFYYFVVGMMLLSPISWKHLFALILPIFVVLVFSSNLSFKLRLSAAAIFLITCFDELELIRYLYHLYLPEKIPYLLALASKTSALVLLALFYILRRLTSRPDRQMLAS